jgi:TonB family protein
VFLFSLVGYMTLTEKDVSFYSPPYSVSLVTGDMMGDGGEGGTEPLPAVVDESEPPVSGGEEAGVPVAVEEGKKEKETPPKEKETTRNLDSVIESIRKKVALEEEKKKKEREEHEREIKESLKEDVAKAPASGGGTTPDRNGPEGTRPARPGQPGGGSPFGDENIYASGGSGTGVPDLEFQAYYSEVWKRVRSMWAVPEELLKKDLTVIYTIRINRDGRVLDTWLEKGSGDEYFDETAERALTKADPLPPLPDSYTGNVMDLGIRFHSKKF